MFKEHEFQLPKNSDCADMILESGDFQLILTGVEGEFPDGPLKEKLLGNNVIMGDVQDILQESSLTGTCKKVAKTPQKNPSPSSGESEFVKLHFFCRFSYTHG